MTAFKPGHHIPGKSGMARFHPEPPFAYIAQQSDNTCAPVDAAAPARSVSDNYVIARADAEQLDALLRAM
jgi:hypothetical protein